MPIRITGWLLFDQEHHNHLGQVRATLWEVHPIHSIGFFPDDAWHAL